MAARVKKLTGIEPRMVHGHIGEYRILVDGEKVFEGGLKAVVDILPAPTKLAELVRSEVA